MADEKAVQLFDNAQVRHLLKEDAKKSGRATPRDLETPFGQTIDKASAVAGYMDGTTKISSKSVDALRSWLNCTAMKSPIEHIPRDFVNSNGKILIELID